jgi:hypothetical protein
MQKISTENMIKIDIFEKFDGTCNMLVNKIMNPHHVKNLRYSGAITRASHFEFPNGETSFSNLLANPGIIEAPPI